MSQPDEIAAALDKARHAIAAGELKTALRWADRARRCVGEGAEIDGLIGHILLGLGETEEGLARLDAAKRPAEPAAPRHEDFADLSLPDHIDYGQSQRAWEPRSGPAGRLWRRIALAWTTRVGASSRPRPASREPRYDDAPRETAAWPDPRELAEGRLLQEARPFVLLVSHNRLGGVERFVQQRCGQIEAEGGAPLVLRADRDGGRVRLTTPDAVSQPLAYDPASEADHILSLIQRLQPKALEIHHFIDHDAACTERLLALGLKLTVYVHDYSWICPRLTLITGSGKYCGEPDVRQCDACVALHGSSLDSTLSTGALRARSARWLTLAERIVAPTHDVADRLARYFPELTISVEPWEAETFEAPAPAAPMPRTVKVAVIGAIGLSKGYDVLLDCVRDARARALPIEFVVVGFTENDAALMAAGEAFVTGRYEETEVDALIRREAPDVAVFLSVWPETWCYCLTHALRARLPIVAFDLGAIAERLNTADAIAELLPVNAEAEAINNAILSITLRRHEASRAPRSALRPPAAAQTAALSADVSSGVSIIMQPFEFIERRDSGAGAPIMPEQSIGLTASVQLVTLNKGVYSFSVQQASPSRVNDDNDLRLPAIQISLAPGVALDQVEFMTSLRSDGAWLVESADMLIAKVKVAGTPVLVTSYSARGLAPLSINVDRIDGRRATASAPLPAPAGVPTSAPIPGLGGPRPVAALLPRDRTADLVTSGEPRFAEDGRRIVRTQITAHISMRGDVSFVDETWAGVMGERLPIEAFAILPLELISPDEIEYKVLSEKGVETPWTSGGQFCGTRQMNLWLSGFAVRLKGAAAKAFDCSYRGSFRSGAIVGPLTNGAPVCAATLDDVLQAIQVTITEVGATQTQRPSSSPRDLASPEPEAATAARVIGPRFSVFREEIG